MSADLRLPSRAAWAFCALAFAFTLALGAGCATTAAKPPAPRQPGEVVRARSASLEIITAVRPTPGVVRVSLWIDAGSRDAAPSQVATLAGWLAADSGGSELQAMVYPDATELWRTCSRQQLDECIAQLGRALRTRNPTPSQAVKARVRLRDGRRLALAHQPMRRAHAAALTALFGEGAAGFQPLGAAEHDDAASSDVIGTFLNAHYGPARALLVAAGDADPDSVREAATQALAGAPAAALPRATRTFALPDAPRVEVVVDEQDAVVVAMAAPSVAQAHAFSEHLQRSLTRDPLSAVQSSATVFAVRGAALSWIELRGPSLDAAVRAAARELARAAPATELSEAPPGFTDDLGGVTQSFALPWSTHGDPAVNSVTYALGIMVRGGRADGVRTQDPDAALRQRTLTRANDTLASAQRQAHPTVRGAVQPHAASVVTENGARVEVRRIRGPQVAIALRSLLGAGHDPPLLLGRAALLATLTTTACAGMTPSALDAELARLHATLVPRVDAHSYGVLLRVPSAQWRDGLDLALRCMQTPSRETPHLADALLRLHSRLDGADSPQAHRARVAAIVAPRAPGAYAPWGAPSRLGSLEARELSNMLTTANSGARTVVSIAGELPVAEAVRHAAALVSTLPPGALPTAPLELGQPDALVALGVQGTMPASSGEPLSVLAVWHTRGSQAHALGAQVASAALQAVLARTPGIDVLWRDGDAFDDDAWAALALRVAPDAVPTIGALLADAAAKLDTALLAEAVQKTHEGAELAAANAASRVDAVAERVAVERVTGKQRAHGALPAVDTALKLVRTAPYYVTFD